MTTHDYRYCSRCGKEFQIAWRMVDIGFVEPVYCPTCEALEIADAVVREPVYQIEVHAT